MSELEYPPVRSNADCREAFEQLAKLCENETNPEEIADRIMEAKSLILEARVPKADNEHELRAMLEEGFRAPEETFRKSDEVLEDLKNRTSAAKSERQRLDRMLRSDAYDSIIMEMFPSLPDKDCLVRFGLDLGWPSGEPRAPTAKIVHPNHTTVSATAPVPSLALLAAILRAHHEWPEIWRR